jgi:hypothetical protein
VFTVISRSALLQSVVDYGRSSGGDSQDLQKMICLFIRLCKKTQRESSNSIVAPRLEQCDEKRLAVLDKLASVCRQKSVPCTLLSRFLSRLLKSASSGAVMRLLLRF